MQTTLRRLGEDVIGYGIGAGLNRLLGLVVAVIYPLLLSRAEYGSLDVVFSLTALLALVLFLGLEHGLVRFYYEDDDLIRRRRLVSTVFYAVTAVTLGVTAAMLVFSRPLALRLYDDPRYIAFLRIALAGMPFAMVNGVQLLVLRLERRVRAFNLLAAANLALAALIGIGGIVLLDWGAAGVLVGVAVANAAAALAGTTINWRELWHAPQPAALREMVAIGAPLLLAAGAQWVLQYVDRVFLVRMVTADEVGLYAIANGGVSRCSARSARARCTPAP